MAKITPSKIVKGDGLTLLSRLALEIPQVTSRAMNDLAWKARNNVRDSLKDNFTLRTRWMKNGIRIKNSNWRTGSPAEVYSLDDWTAQHEEGGIKSSVAGHRIAVPITREAGSPHGIRKNIRTILKNTGRPTPLRATNHRIMPLKGKEGKNSRAWVLFRERKTKVKSEKTGRMIIKRRPIYLYVFVDEVRIEPRLHMRETVLKTIRENANAALEAALEKHLKKGKR